MTLGHNALFPPFSALGTVTRLPFGVTCEILSLIAL